MKLLYVTDNGFTCGEGKCHFDSPNQAHIHNLSNFFDEFVVVARQNPYVDKYKRAPDNVKVFLVPKWNVFKLCKTLNRLIKECDAVICYCANGYFAAHIGKKYNKVVITYIGGDPFEALMSRGDLKGSVLAYIVRYMWKSAASAADYVHYCHEWFFQKFPTSGKTLACSGVDIICEDSVLEARIKKINERKNIYKLGLIGYTKNRIKGIDIAIKTLAKLGSNYNLEIVGRGETDSLRSLASELGCDDRVKFIGVLTSTEVKNWLDSVDIYIQPSRSEGLPRATIEAMSRACPVVCSDAGALPAIINEIFVFEKDKEEEMLDKIRNISNTITMKEEATRNFEEARKFDRSERDKKYKAFYTEVVEEINKRENIK